MKIFLVGYMGSGKSKTGASLAKVLKIDFVDTDNLIEEKEGKSTEDIFAHKGEMYFRKCEGEILDQLLLENRSMVISTGGGLPCFEDNMDMMNQNGITVYLEANVGLLYQRLKNTPKQRPLLEGLNDIDLMDYIKRHLMLRESYYKKAKLIVSAANIDVKYIKEKIKLFKTKE